MQEEETQGANPAKNNTLLYSRKLVASEDREGRICWHIKENRIGLGACRRKNWVLVSLGRAVVVVQVHVPRRSGLSPRMRAPLDQGTALRLRLACCVCGG